MREDKLNFGILIRIFVSLLPILFGMPTIATIICAYTIAMTFVTAGTISTIASSLCAIAATMFFSSFGAGGELYGLTIGIQAVLCAIGCILGLFRKKDFFKGLILATVGILIPQLIYASSTAHADGMSLARMLVPSIEEFKAMVDPTFATLPKDVNEMLTQSGVTVETFSELIRSFTVMIIPSALILSSMVIAYIVMWAVSAPIRKYPNEKIHSFSKIKLPSACTVLVIILAVALACGVGRGNMIINTVIINMLIIFVSLAFFSGISLVDFYLRKALPFNFLRVIIHMIILMNFFPVYILAAFVDSFANFRKLPKVTDKEGGGGFETKK